LRKLFKNLISKKGFEYDLKFDWITKKSKIPRDIGYEDPDDEETDYKKRLKDLFN
jgi:hypothetical protein